MSRLRDKKINTASERRMVQISTSIVNKSKTTYVTRGIWTRDGTWGGADVWPGQNNSIQLNQATHITAQFARIGGYVNNDLSVEMTIGNDPANPTEQPARPYNFRDMFLRIKALKFVFRICNVGIETALVDICLFRCPMRKRLLALSNTGPTGIEANQPQIYWHKSFTTLNSVTSQCESKWKNQAANLVPNNHTLIAHKRFSVSPGRILDDPGAGGGGQLNQIKWKTVTIAKYYSGLGKREKYELVLNPISPDAANMRGQLADARYYFSMRSSTPAPLLYHAVSVCQFQKGRNTPRQVVFDEVAHGAL